MPIPPDMLIFIHIPKTGGLTLERIINRQYPPQSTFWLSLQRPKQVAAYRALGAAEKAKLTCLMGHMPFGFHQEPGRTLVHTTLLREPVARFVSEYRFLLRLRGTDVWQPPAEAMQSLESYLEYRVANHAMNVQTNMISGYCPAPEQLPVFDPLPADALEKAKANLRTQFAVVGVTERFDEALLLLKRRLGWKRRINYARRNVAPTPFSAGDLPPALIARIRELTPLDRELVAYAETLLDAAVAAEGASFPRELAALKRQNHRIHQLMFGWKSTVLGRVGGLPGIRQARHVIGSLLARFF